MRLRRWKHSSVTQHLLGIVQGFAEILDGCVTLASLGFYMSDFEMTISRYRALTRIKDLKKASALEKTEACKNG